MTFAVRRPSPPLDRYIELLWWYEGVPPAHAAERMLPTAAPQLVVNLRDDVTLVAPGLEPAPFERLRGATLGGACLVPFVIPTAQQRACAGVIFRPGGGFPFLGGHPAADLLNAHVSLDALWGPAADRLVERLVTAPSPQAGLGVLEETLGQQMRPTLEPHAAVIAALAGLGRGAYRQPIARLAEAIGISQQRLGQLFHDQVGLTPKQLARVWRFQAALRLLGADPTEGWAERALACGFVDQSHLTRDFRAFTGLAPAAYLARWGARTNHLPLDG
ncbi:MAG TPA: helix-turn-helix domain-containing protein [Chloroflexaceae bacterium]|nr:helix-turn-helix domain-containing protein [Chloroflexaceae bacterium]